MSKIERRPRVYFPASFSGEDAAELRRCLKEMLQTPLAFPSDLILLIEKYGELSDILEEVGAWKEIRMTQQADDPELSRIQADYFSQVIAPAQPYFFRLDRKIRENNFFAQLPAERYAQLGKILRSEIDLYREENIPLEVEENALVSKYAELYSSLTVEFEGKERTLKEMELVQKDKDRERRERGWRLVAAKLLERREDFESLFDQLKELRASIAANAGFANYRDFSHQAAGRFDYTPQDLLRFHASIEEVVLPALSQLNARRRDKLGVDRLRPWDLAVDLGGEDVRPFADTDELLRRALAVLNRVEPGFASELAAMAEDGLLDLPNRKGKAPGGYNCTLPETGSSFIFMNAVGVKSDVQTLLHEAGHAFHAIAMRGERIAPYKNPPQEVNELASMSMELLTLDKLDEFYPRAEDLRSTQREVLEEVLALFPLVAMIDAFQHWIYLYPGHTPAERDAQFSSLKERFNAGVDWSGLETERGIGWLRVLHIFEVPFYYIEYALAQMGAVALYKSYRQDPARALQGYHDFMALGYSRPVPEIYAAAHLRFDFSAPYLGELVDFLTAEISRLDQGKDE